MDLMEAIQQRRSIRAFRNKPVPKDTIMEILNIACRAPSAMNTQPWEFAVVSGKKLDKLRAAIVEKLKNGAPIVPDHLVVSWPNEGVYKQRQITLAKQLFKAMDIQREDTEKRAWWLERGFRFFDAPAAIIIICDKVLGEAGPLLDLGAVMQNICLAAMQFGLGTCIEDQGVLYPEVFREHTGIPQTKRLMIAIAIGYPDLNFPANQIRSGREPAENLTTWVE
ncbi:nitroreductase [Smithella sp. SC_K08D17]|jgi:nitroreductase|nr:nitroreductase [Smithella sp. D17]KIE17490.1 nitroreductase [Smithella sp. SC_K08D17]MDD5525225.1 nitroreductase [Smithella sp.]